MFVNNVFEHCKVSTTKHPASIIMLGIIVSNGEKMHPVWFQRGYEPTSAVYKEVLETKFSCIWSRRSLRNQINSWKGRSASTHGKDCSVVVGRQHELSAQKFFCFHSHQISIPMTSVWGRTLRKSLASYAIAARMRSMFLWTAHGRRWGKTSSGLSARDSDLDLSVL